MPSTQETTNSESPPNRQAVELSNDERKLAFRMLTKELENGKLRHGAITNVAKLLGSSLPAIKRIWDRGIEVDRRTGRVVKADEKKVHKRRYNSGRPIVHDPVEFANAVASLPPQSRSSLRQIANALGVNVSLVYRMQEKGVFPKPQKTNKEK